MKSYNEVNKMQVVGKVLSVFVDEKLKVSQHCRVLA